MKNFLKVVNGFIERSNRDHISAYAAQSAYFILLSFIPFILLLMTSVALYAADAEHGAGSGGAGNAGRIPEFC